MRYTAALFAIAALLFSAPVDAQQAPSRRSIEITSFGTDPVGDLLLTAVRNAFRQSDRYDLVLSNGEIGLRISTLGIPDGDRSDLRSVYGLVWFIRRPDGVQSFLSSTVGWTGRDAVNSAAAGILARTDSVLMRAPGPGADARTSQFLGW
jgi:hypothetical protein